MNYEQEKGKRQSYPGPEKNKNQQDKTNKHTNYFPLSRSISIQGLCNIAQKNNKTSRTQNITPPRLAMLPSQTQTLAIPPDRKTKYGKWFIIHILNSITNLPSLNHSKCNYYRINAYSNFRYTIRMTHRLKKLIRKMLPASLFRSLQPKYHGLLAVLAHYWYGKPSDKLVVIGVTGTKGKTSTAHIIYQLLNALGASCGLISTAVIDEGKGQQMNWFRMTQMSGPITHRLLSHIVKSGKRYVVVEVSSEGLAQHRHLGINFDIAVFTNLTPDHIDAHGSFQAYKEAKAILFKAIGALQITKEKKAANPSTAKTIISNLDSEHGLYYLNFRADAHITYAIDNQTAVLVAKNLEIKTKGSTFEIRGSRFTLDLPGKFNVYNTLAAIGVAHSLGFKMETIAGAAKKLTPIPGIVFVVAADAYRTGNYLFQVHCLNHTTRFGTKTCSIKSCRKTFGKKYFPGAGQCSGICF
jgi:hypothetical protein